jgi:hypothetical protein
MAGSGKCVRQSGCQGLTHSGCTTRTNRRPKAAIGRVANIDAAMHGWLEDDGRKAKLQ